MNCSCGHHHTHSGHSAETSGINITMDQPLIALSGQLICADTAEMMLVLSILPEHIQLSRAEPGCLRFDIWQDDDPMIWHLSELFVDAEAFAAHNNRAQASQWGKESAAIKRAFEKREITPVIRAATPKDTETAAVLFDRRSELDAEPTLVAEAASVFLGYIAVHDGDVVGPFVSDKLTGTEVKDALLQEMMRKPV